MKLSEHKRDTNITPSINHLRSVIEEITPNRASELLSRNIDNRPLRKGTVLALSRAMERGEWMLTHQGIAIDQQGRLIDGQHRLAAVVKSGVTIFAMVTYGVSRNSYDALDQGIQRSARDFFKSRFIAGSCAYLGRVYWNYKPTMVQLEAIRSALSPAYRALDGYSDTAAAKFSSAPVTSGLVMTALRMPNRGPELVLQYYALVNAAFDSPYMTPKLHTLVHQLLKKYRMPSDVIFVKAMRAFENDSTISDQLFVHSTAGELARVRTELSALIGKEAANEITRRT